MAVAPASDTFNGLLDEIRVIRGAVSAPGAQRLAQSNLLLRTHVLDLADATPISPPSGPATGSSNGLHLIGNFLADARNHDAWP